MVKTVAKDPPEQRVLDDIAELGWHVVNVLEDETHAPHLFTIGLVPTFSFPEILIIGLDPVVAHSMTSIIVQGLRKGERPKFGKSLPNILDGGYECVLVEVPKNHYGEYVGFARWYYEGDDFPIVQCVWPDKLSRFPWSEGAPEDFRAWQPVLGSHART